jgi:hypothetical protein
VSGVLVGSLVPVPAVVLAHGTELATIIIGNPTTFGTPLESIVPVDVISRHRMEVLPAHAFDLHHIHGRTDTAGTSITPVLPGQ